MRRTFQRLAVVAAVASVLVAGIPAAAMAGQNTFTVTGARVVVNTTAPSTTRVSVQGTVKDTRADGLCAWVRVIFDFRSGWDRFEDRKACGADNPAASFSWTSPSDPWRVYVGACRGDSGWPDYSTCSGGYTFVEL